MIEELVLGKWLEITDYGPTVYCQILDYNHGDVSLGDITFNRPPWSQILDNILNKYCELNREDIIRIKEKINTVKKYSNLINSCQFHYKTGHVYCFCCNTDD